MAITAQSNVASLIRKTLERQTANKTNFKFKKNQVQEILIDYIRQKNDGPYKNLIKVIQDYTLTDENFENLFEDSLSCVVLLGKDMHQYVNVLCNVEWVNRSEKLIEIYSRFLLNLVTAHTYHCQKVMTCLLKLFKAEGENWGVTPPNDLTSKWSNIHTIIAQIVAVMPMTSNLLLQKIVEQFPYYRGGCFSNRAYIHNLIWMSKYIPSLREPITMAIIGKMIAIDVNIVEQDKNKAKSDAVHDMDVDDQDTLTDTMDYCMWEMLKWLEEEREPMLNIMCNVFEKIILPTYGIRHVQFLLLYTISINQQCADRILDNLWKVAAGLHGLGPGAFATRRTSANHLAGLLARCVRVPNSRLICYLKNMAEWCHSYITAAQESTSVTDNVKAHGAFHAMCHAIFYLIAFKSHHLFTTKENVNFIESLNLPRLVTCNLNPLRTCPPQVTYTFSSVTRQHQVAYCQAIIERNARQTLHSSVILQYDEWFPYDPYTLPTSGKIIWPLCIDYKNNWKEVDDQTQYSGMKRKLEAEDDDYLMMTPAKKIHSTLSNSISPGFKTSENILL